MTCTLDMMLHVNTLLIVDCLLYSKGNFSGFLGCTFLLRHALMNLLFSYSSVSYRCVIVVIGVSIQHVWIQTCLQMLIKPWTCQICLNKPSLTTPKVEPEEQGEYKDIVVAKVDEKIDEKISKVFPKTASPVQKSPKRKRTLKFVHRKRSKLKNKKAKTEESIASIESEESEGGSLSDDSPLSSPVKGSDSSIKTSVIHKRCPTAGCDGKGHLTGRFSMHHTISGCPKYHDTTAEECRVRTGNIYHLWGLGLKISCCMRVRLLGLSHDSGV